MVLTLLYIGYMISFPYEFTYLPKNQWCKLLNTNWNGYCESAIHICNQGGTKSILCDDQPAHFLSRCNDSPCYFIGDWYARCGVWSGIFSSEKTNRRRQRRTESLKQVILGTAGHIDHGKTTLIKKVTGINTDRLKEEQERGITIELGFAYLNLPSGQRVGIVDVPGHEKFVKNMVAGAAGIDIVALVIAADEGVMPQTREHLEICSLLGVKNGFVVLTKIDMVDEEWLELVIEDINQFVAGTFLEGKPVIPVSSTTGEGIDKFIEAVERICETIPAKTTAGIFRLPVDRVFTMKGFGTVITGTLISGKINTGDTVMIYPSRITSKVRGIQVHNNSVDEAFAGMRTAVNFQGLEKESVNRGDVLSLPDELIPSYMLDVSFTYLKSNKKNLKNRSRIRFHTGTVEALGNVIFLEKDEIQPGEEAIAQIRFDVPLTTVKNDRFVIRSYSPIRTIGGGEVVNPIPVKHKRFKKEIVEGIQVLTGSDPELIVEHFIEASDYRCVSFPELKIMTNLSDKKLNNTLQTLLSKNTILLVDKDNLTYIHQKKFGKLKENVLILLADFHKANPLKAGIQKEELKSKFSHIPDPRLFNRVLQHMTNDRTVVLEEKAVRLADHKISLEAGQADVKESILKTYQKDGLTPPYFKELSKTLNIDPKRAKDVLNLLIDEGAVVKIKEDLFFSTDHITDLKNKIIQFLNKHGELSTPQFKEMTGLSRKYLIPLLEYFDATNVTIRVGDVRKLRSG